MQALIVPDKFKGTLTAAEAAAAMARGWSRRRPQDTLDVLPLSDGGDGFGEVLSGLLGGDRMRAGALDAAHRVCRAAWWWEPRTRTAIVESARVIGLARLPRGRFHPFALDTGGLGVLLQTVAEHRPARCLIGVGGSATNDGGYGLARALGWRFMDRAGQEIDAWPGLAECVEIRPPRQPLPLGRLTVAVDVQNKLLGPRGCTRVYGPQKGLKPSDFVVAERALRRLAKLVRRGSGTDLAGVPGAGAAGGLGFGLMAFCGARAESGFAIFSREARLPQRVRRADLVITGEGSLDDQSLMGKGVGELAALCRRAGVPCLALVGVNRSSRKGTKSFERVHALSPRFVTAGEATTRPALHLRHLAAQVAREWLKG